MKERGKSVEKYSGKDIPDFNYSSSSDLPCKKHPSSSSVGICAQCLKDRLIKLVCSDCGEQRLSSCSCSEVSNPNSCNLEVGSVGRVSFLIENESHSKPKNEERPEEVIHLKRSSSSCVDVRRGGGFWKIGRLFRKKREKGSTNCEGSSFGGFDEKSELWVFDYMGVSRSRSLCSYRDESSDFNFSSAKISDVTGGMMLDSSRQSGFNETESRKSGFRDGFDSEIGSNLKGVRKGVFVVKESDFNGMDDSAFIDLKLDLSSESKTEYSVSKMSELSSDSGFGGLRSGSFVGHSECGSVLGDGFFKKGGSCRITVSDRGIRKGRRAQKVWKWIFRHHSGWRTATKKDENIA
ncbi:uncharacterized protein LOC132302689 [Cornus florida]|uniref:uncharacterized protein LOC132302689 n=1 Tax=Cornus florida TaxID=4283 RepID=UPI00289A2AAD|nr:uncharacterized protein LOC132302689 [Cornus florida]